MKIKEFVHVISSDSPFDKLLVRYKYLKFSQILKKEFPTCFPTTVNFASLKWTVIVISSVTPYLDYLHRFINDKLLTIFRVTISKKFIWLTSVEFLQLTVY